MEERSQQKQQDHNTKSTKTYLINNNFQVISES